MHVLYLSPLFSPTTSPRYKIDNSRRTSLTAVTLSPLRMTSIEFLLTISPLNHTLRSRELRIWSGTSSEKLLIIKQILLVSTLSITQREIISIDLK